MLFSAPNLLLGAGKSSASLAAYFQEDCLCLTEDSEKSVLMRFSKAENSNSGSWETLETFSQNFDDFDWSLIEFQNVFISPGIDCRRKFFTPEFARKEIKELDFFRSKFEGKIFVVTGTNGKSTATFQIGHLFQKIFGAADVFVGGNLGTPMFDLFLQKPKAKYAVLEISSYQAERLKAASLDWALLLNLAPDHLGRYFSAKEYYRAKWHLLSQARTCYFPRECRPPDELSLTVSCDFSIETPLSEILYLIFLDLQKRRELPSSFEVRPEEFRELPRLAHRLEPIQVTQDVLVINDSKATNVNSVVFALRHRPLNAKSLRLILGGVVKGDDFSDILSHLQETDEIWIYGRDRRQIESQVKSHPGDIFMFESLDQLTDKVFQNLKAGQAVLLSPGAASFDEFKNFEHRGDFFREKALKLLK